MLDLNIKKYAITLRNKGYSLREINSTTSVSKGTLSIWLRDVKLNSKAKSRIQRLKDEGNKRAGISIKKKRKERELLASNNARKVLNSIPDSTIFQNKLICALVYYCEGAKSPKDGVSFINSDAELIKTFINLLRKSFDIQETKIRLCMHLHSYHNEKKQKMFWSDVTKIPTDQFTKTFMKKEGAIYKNEGYPGCLRIRYGDSSIARELLEIAKQYFMKMR